VVADDGIELARVRRIDRFQSSAVLMSGHRIRGRRSPRTANLGGDGRFDPILETTSGEVGGGGGHKAQNSGPVVMPLLGAGAR